MIALATFQIAYVAMCFICLTPGYYKPNSFWLSYIIYNIILSFWLIVLHVWNGREFIRKAKEFRMMYSRPKNVGMVLNLVAIFLSIRCAKLILFLIYPVDSVPIPIHPMPWYIICELVPTFLVYKTILMQRKAQSIKRINESSFLSVDDECYSSEEQLI